MGLSRWTGALFIVNEFFHLQNANNLPSYGAQWLTSRPAHGPLSRPSITARTRRTPSCNSGDCSHSIVEWKVSDDIILAGDFQIGTQEMASTPSESPNVLHGCDFTNAMAYQRALECGGQPEFYWDRTGFFVNVVKNVHLGMAVL